MFFQFGVALLMSIGFASIALLRPEIKLGLVFMPFCILAAMASGYRAFYFSDDWYRAQEHKEQAWYLRHPRLAMTLNAAAIIWMIWLVVHTFRNFVR